MKGDPNLRARLERLASNAGDPPEQGLERVAARRHRRLRRRRGAVVTAAALAVLVGAVSLVLRGGPDPNQVAVSPAGRPAGVAPQPPDYVEVHCTRTGIVIPVASVRPRQDGMHVRVFNELPTPTDVWVEGADWSGDDRFQPGGFGSMRMPVPPGRLRMGCGVSGTGKSVTVDLNDVRGYYEEPELECPADDEAAVVANLRAARALMSLSAAAKFVLAANGYPVDKLKFGPVRGYVGQRLGDPTDDPVVQVDHDGDGVAFVHLGEAQGQSEGPWDAAWRVEGCRSFLDSATTTTTVAAPG